MDKSIIETIKTDIQELYDAGIIDDDIMNSFDWDEVDNSYGDVTNLEPSYYRPFGANVPE